VLCFKTFLLSNKSSKLEGSKIQGLELYPCQSERMETDLWRSKLSGYVFSRNVWTAFLIASVKLRWSTIFDPSKSDLWV